MRKYSLHKRSI